MTDVDLRAAPKPIPAGRGRWRVWLLNRIFGVPSVSLLSSIVAELTDARSRRLDQNLNQPAQFTFTLDGASPEAAMVVELGTEVMVVRWDERNGADLAMFWGPVTQSEDQLSEDNNVVTFTCHDYVSMLTRRILTRQVNFQNVDQDDLVANLISWSGRSVTASDGTSLMPGGYLPLLTWRVNPDGTYRSNVSGNPRTRQYTASTPVWQSIDDLAHVINGFDYDVLPTSPNGSQAYFRIWYPQQGVSRNDVAFVYGQNVSSLTRSVSSSDYANYERVVGNNGSSDPAAAQLFAEYWNSDATAGGPGLIGLWQDAESASDVSIQQTLVDQVHGDVAIKGLIMPSYTLTLRPGAYTWGNPNMGDTVPLIIFAGRLNVNTSVRVVGLSYVIGDDGQEDVQLTVGRPTYTLAQLLARTGRDVDALTRR